ncbi:MAG: M16 family metallopeptidase [Planctomycetota bacterium]|jgi:predicted Zn-dependent peptidase
MKTIKAKFSLNHVLVLVLILSTFSFARAGIIFAYDGHGGQTIEPTMTGPQSEGARIVSKFKYKPIEFTPPKPERLVLDNGMVLYLLEDHDLPVFRISARVRTGAIYEPREKAGLANLVGNVMRRGGTKSRASEQINEELEFIAASVETQISREAGIASLSAMKKDIDNGLEIFADVLMNPAFPEEMIRKEKDELLEEIRRENDSPRQIVFREFRKILYKADHPYSRKINGYKDTIESITRDDMIAFHKKYFHPNNVIMGISGDFDSKEIVKKIKSVFAEWKSAEINFPEVPAVEKEFKRSVNYIYKDVNQATVVFGHIGIDRLNKDYFPIKIMNFILGGGSFTSRIPSKVRSDEGLAYSAYSAFHTPRDLGFFFASCQTKSESTVRAINLALDEVRKIREEQVDDEELELAKDTYINQFIFKFTSSASVVAQMVGIEYEGLPLNYLETYVDSIKVITKEDIMRVAKKYLHPDDIKLLVIGDMEKFDKPLAEFGEVNTIELE